MKHAQEYRDKELVRPLMERLLADIAELEQSAQQPLRIMEVCGTHTMSIFKSGIKSLLPKNVELVSGPGCPVCVTAANHIDYCIDIVQQKNVRLAIFGDLFRVPGTRSSLAEASANGASVQIVYSPMDALQLAIKNPDERIVFAGIGFETTTPTIAATILAAKRSGVDNFLVFPCMKTMIEPLNVLFADRELRLDALLIPGHVATIIGMKPWQGIAEQFHLASVIAGFESADLLEALIMICKQIKEKKAVVENAYPRAVHQDGNSKAEAMTHEVFEPCDMVWRGLGVLPKSGLAIQEQYRSFDAGQLVHFSATNGESDSPKGCRCGEVLRGKITPQQCPLFGTACTPPKPIGPCMVSSEGVCAAHYKYG